jgi:hypothetical protein
MFVVNRSGRKAFLIKLKKMRVEKFVAVALKVETLRIVINHKYNDNVSAVMAASF